MAYLILTKKAPPRWVQVFHVNYWLSPPLPLWILYPARPFHPIIWSWLPLLNWIFFLLYPRRRVEDVWLSWSWDVQLVLQVDKDTVGLQVVPLPER